MSKEEEKPRPRKLMAYLGMREGEKRKSLHAYVDVGDDWQTREFPLVPLPALNDGLHLYGKRFGFARPGAVISIEHETEEKGTVYSDSAEVVGYIDDKTAAAWKAASDAARTVAEVGRRARSEARRDLQLEILEPLREAYRGLRNRNQRTALLARVMAYITG
jgi:hypothetical protein